jgi:hypothetical protein
VINSQDLCRESKVICENCKQAFSSIKIERKFAILCSVLSHFVAFGDWIYCDCSVLCEVENFLKINKGLKELQLN